jgi:hypothetical protein
MDEGGELSPQRCLWRVMDNPDLVICYKRLALLLRQQRTISITAESVDVLTLHVNGFKISKRTILGTMDDKGIYSRTPPRLRP